MKRSWIYKLGKNLFAAAIIMLAVNYSFAQDMTYAFPRERPGGMEILVKCDSVGGATAYAFRFNANGGGWSAWDSIGNVRTKNYTGAAYNTKYCFQSRAYVGGSWQAPGDSLCNLHGPELWPASTSPNNCNSEAVDLLNGFGDPLDIGGVYLHSGVDINAINNVGNECLKAPMGAIVSSMSGTYNGVNLVINLEVHPNSTARLLQFNHVDSIDMALMVGKSVEHRQKLAQIDDRPTGFGWTVLTSHTHFHYYGFGSFFGTTWPPYIFYDSLKYRDPQGNRPQVMNRNGGPDSLYFGKGPDRTDYFPKDTVHNEVDIYVEAVDRQSRDIPWVNPKELGYYIQQMDNGAWKDVVQNSAKPYKLIDTKNFYNTHAGTTGTMANKTFMHIIMDTTAGKRNIKWPNYVWNSHNNWCLTNTTDTSGSRATMNKDASFATDARKDETAPNGWKSGYNKSKCNDDAKFSDGNYRVGVMLADWGGRAPYYYRNFQIDNYKPYLKSITMTTDGTKIYDVKWEWQRASDNLKFTKDNNLSGKAKCDKDLIIEVETSEPMQFLVLYVPKCDFTKYLDSSDAEAGSNYKKFKITIPADKVANGADQAPVELSFDGKDLSGNLIYGWNTETDRSGDQIPRRKIDGTWNVGNASQKEDMHEFELDTVEIEADITDATCEGIDDGEIDLTVVKGESPLTFEWSNGATGEDITGLGPGMYSVIVKDKNQCKAEEEYEVGETDPITASVSGGGTFEVRPCDPNPEITLTASASGGETPYTYSWGDPVKTVSSEGEYSVTVTDNRGCKDDATAYVWFIQVLCSRDPNDIIGPIGYGDEKWVSTFEILPYRIRFENDPDFATAPAQKVTINHPLDTNTDIRNFRLGEYGFGSFRFTVPDNTVSYSKRLDLRDSLGIYVDVTAGLDITKREAFWIFESIDPSTGLPPDNASSGFLPVNDTATHSGEGYVDYIIKARGSAQTGDSIRAIADIVFDDNEEIVTPRIFNLIDAVAPLSAMNGLKDINDSIKVLLTWQAADDPNASGLRLYDLYYSANNQAFSLHTEGITDTFYLFAGNPGSSYRFYTVAEDNVGNREPVKTDSFATTSLPADGDFLKPADTSGFCIGDTLHVEWYKSNLALIDLEYSADTGKSFLPIASGVSVADTVFYWILPDSLSSGRDYLVRAVSTAGQTPLDTSEGFTVSTSPVVSIGNDTTFCANESISVTLDAGNSGSFYLWSTADTSQQITITGAGVYGVTVTNPIGCKGYDEISVDTMSAPAISASVSDNACFGGSTGAIDISVSSGTPPYSYLWNTSDTSPDISGLLAAVYSLQVTDSNGCSVSDTFEVDEPPSMSIGATITGVSCFGGSDGSINTSVSGGLSPFSYNWSNGDTTSYISGLAAGSYVVTVTDSGNCQAVDTFTVGQPTLLISSTLLKQVTCFGGNNGQINLSVSGGTMPYTYSWSNSDTTQDINNLMAGVYSVTITDSLGCMAYDTGIISQPNQITITDTIRQVSCYNGSDGRISLGVTGGYGNYSYLWSNSSTSAVVTGLDSGIYTVTVTDDSSCSAKDTFLITHPAELKATYSVSDATCFGNTDGSIDMTVSGGTTPYTFNWSNAATSEDITGLAAGDYSVIVTDDNGCLYYDTITVNEPLQMTLQDTITDIACHGDMTGEIRIGVQNGTGTVTYTWNTGQSTRNIAGLAAGVYTVIASDANSCVVNDTFVLSQPSDLTLTDSLVHALCAGNSDGVIDITVSGATAPYTFEWDDLGSSEDRQNLASGIYYLLITDDNGCEWSDSFTINEPLPIIAGIVETHITCFDAKDGMLDLTASGGTGTLAYNWTGGAFTEDLNNLDTGTYVVVITDQNGCEHRDTALINQPLPLNVDAVITLVTCFGEATGAIDITVSGGVTPYVPEWEHGPVSQDLSGIGSGIYILDITDDHLCTITDTFEVTEPDALAVNSAIDHVLCADSAGGSIQLVVLGGTLPYHYIWNTGDTTANLFNLPAGEYTLDISDSNGCVVKDTVLINEPDPVVLASVVTPVSCNGESNGAIDLTVSGGVSPYKYNWNNSETTEDISGLAAGTYTATVTDSNGCTVTDTIAVSEPDALVLELDSIPASGDNSDGKAWVTVTGGNPPYTYLWDDPQAQTTDTAFDLVSATYTVVVTDDNGCTASGNITVTKSTGFEVIEPMNDVLVYPNPNTGIVTIYYLSRLGTDVELEVTDYAGRTVSRQVISNQDRFIYTFEKDAAEGVYIFRLKSDDQIRYKRIILVR